MIPSPLLSLANHLWQSTLFAAVAGLLALAFRRNRAQIRYSLWLAASVKFLIPFSVLVIVGSHFAPHTLSQAAPSPIPLVIREVSQPDFFAATVPLATMPPAQPSFQSLIPLLLGVLWAIGFAIVSAGWWKRWRQIRTVLRSASPLRLSIGIKAMSAPEFIEPGVFGVWRPILLLPNGITDHLTPGELDTILAHELCHIRRRDNFAAALHMAVEALFWFHPLVWWLGGRLMEERERACDEEVLRSGSEPAVYAEGILKICERYAASSFPCSAGVTGGNLKKRIEEIVANRTKPLLSVGKKLLLAAAGMLAVILPVAVGITDAPLGAQSPDISWEAAAGGKRAFEVASVKPSKMFKPPNFPLDPGDAKTPGGRFSAVFPLVAYVTFAYKLNPGEVSAQMPKSFPESFDIEARAPGNPTKDQMRLMMQSLLADRFKLRVHFETHEGPVYALTLVRRGRTGPKLRPHAEGPDCPDFEMAAPLQPIPPRKPGDVFPPVCGWPQTRGTREGTLVGGRDVPLEIIAAETIHGFGSLVGEVDKPVVDQTGLKGRYDFTMQLPPGIMSFSVSVTPPNPDGSPADPKGTPFLNAMRDQLGLKLVASKGPIRKLVIDHVEQLSPN
jgi:uncharacterized protein (TIGR03435 family)